MAIIVLFVKYDIVNKQLWIFIFVYFLIMYDCFKILGNR